jgi:hypothetical protein
MAGCEDPFRSASDWILAPGLGVSDGQCHATRHDMDLILNLPLNLDPTLRFFGAYQAGEDHYVVAVALVAAQPFAAACHQA